MLTPSGKSVSRRHGRACLGSPRLALFGSPRQPLGKPSRRNYIIMWARDAYPSPLNPGAVTTERACPVLGNMSTDHL
jgi:hypothetical protein